MDSICDGYEFDMYLYLIHIKFISITYQIHINYVMCCTKMSCSVDLLLFLQIQMSSYIYFIVTVSNTYQIHINYIFCWAPLCNFCFSSNQDFIIHIFNWNYIKCISNTYPLQIKFISITYSVVLKWAALWIFWFSLNPDFIIHLFHWNCIKYVSNSYPLQIKSISITHSVIPKWASLFIFLLFLQIQTLSLIYFIETVSNTYQIHIHYR